MVTKQKKEEIVAKLVEKISKSTALYLVDCAGLTAVQAVEIRNEFRKADGEIYVAKNTLIRRALEQVGGFDMIPADIFKMQTALVVGYDAVTAPAKYIRTYSEKNNGKLSLKCAVIDGQYFPGSDIKVVAELPTREDMIAGILGSINAPISGIVGSVNAVMRDLASVIEEVAKTKAA